MLPKTGYPATKLTVAETIDKGALKDKDILVFGENSRILDGIDKEDAGVAIDKIKQGIEKSLTKAVSDDKNMESVVAEDAGIAAIVQYQSPFSDDRSVVAVLGDGQTEVFINKRLMIPGDLKLIDGSVAVFKTNATPTSYNIGPTYYTQVPCRGTKEFGTLCSINPCCWFSLLSSAHCCLPVVFTT